LSIISPHVACGISFAINEILSLSILQQFMTAYRSNNDQDIYTRNNVIAQRYSNYRQWEQNNHKNVLIRSQFKVTLYDENTDFIIFYIFIDLYSGAGDLSIAASFFKKILKCVRHITKNIITTDSFAAKVVIGVILDIGCLTFNLVCVFVVHDRSSTAFSFGRFRSVCIAIPFLHLRFAGILASFFCVVSRMYGLW
jgi:hypothetical protein